ncbi:hypothetical protein GCM10025875_29160 [Litorihabitans aurantiacus]|uniref:YdbS-like PH domain-containing protein n=1 Tax=Litorihabitans aurantiacus TaxID=1930061 RepID=A0AA37XGS5_9MICO|nr:hypothetical protein GCM10025875_29160 [Litorihabitans aurantiacus]
MRNEIDGWIQGDPFEPGLAVVVAGIVAVGVALVLADRAVNRHQVRYAITDRGLHVRRRGLSSTATTYPAARIDGVEIAQSITDRLFGLATLKVEVSGGASSGGAVTGLPLADAREWRDALLVRRDAARRAATPGSSPTGGDDGDAPPLRAHEHREDDGGAPVPPATTSPAPPDDPPPGRLLLAPGPDRARRYALRAVQPWAAAVACLVGGTLAVVGLVRGEVGGSLGLLLAAGAAGFGAVRTVVERWRRVATWQVHEHDGDLVVSRGRWSRTRRTVRAGRVCAVVLTQGPIDRRSGWWTLKVAVPALGSSAGEDGADTVAVAATADEVRRLTRALLPGLDEAMHRELAAALGAARPPSTWLLAQPYARLFSPLTWRTTGLRTDEAHVLARGGRWSRWVRVVDRTRIQRVTTETGPRDRRRGGANLTIHLPPGPAVRTVVPHLEAGAAGALRDELALTRALGASARPR